MKQMNIIYCALFLTIQVLVNATKIDVGRLKCLVCETTILEFEKALSKVNPNLKVNVGGYRLDADGTVKQKTVSQINSEIFLSDKLDEICKKMDDYVRATKKSNGQLTLLKLIGDDGQMSPEMGEVDIIQDDDLNKSLKYYCESLLEEHEDAIVSNFSKGLDDLDIRICSLEAKLCDKTLPTDSENYINEEL